MEWRHRAHDRPDWAWHHSCRSVLHVHVGRHSTGPAPVLFGGCARRRSGQRWADAKVPTAGVAGPARLELCGPRARCGFGTTGRASLPQVGRDGRGESGAVSLRFGCTGTAENPARFRFASDAQELFVGWLAELEAKIRRNELHAALVSHLSKYRSLMPSLALLFHLADAAVNGAKSDTVSFRHAEEAAAWCRYLESHARRVYSCIVTPRLRAARELAEKIKQRKIGADGFFSCRDVYLKGWSGLDSPEVG